MEHQFIKVKSSEFCLSIFDGTHDSPKYQSEGFPLITSKCLIDNKVNVSIASLISEFDYNSINKRSKVEIDDVLVSMIGTVGTIALIKTEPCYAIKNIGVLRAKDKLDALYLFYYMQSQTAQNEIRSSLVGSTQPFLSLDKLRNFPIWIPTIRELKQHIVNTISFLLLKFL